MKTFYIFDYEPIKVEIGAGGSFTTSDQDGKILNYETKGLGLGDVNLVVLDWSSMSEKTLSLKYDGVAFTADNKEGDQYVPEDIMTSIAENVDGTIICFSEFSVMISQLSIESIQALEDISGDPSE